MPLVLDPIQSGYNLSKINDNFEKIQDTWDEKLDRVNSGSFYNQMDQTLDMNSNEIINVKVGDSDGSLVTKGYVDQQDELRVLKSGDSMSGQLNTIDPVQPSNATNKRYVDGMIASIDGVDGIVPLVSPRQQGDGVTTIFPTVVTSQRPTSSYSVNLDGVTQRPQTDYTADTNGNVVFAEAPEIGVDIDITVFEPVNLQEAADLSQVTATGTTTPRTLADRFADVISAKDFGAVGDGVTNDTVAIQSLFNSKGELYINKGTYLIGSLLIPSESTITIEAGTSFIDDGSLTELDPMFNFRETKDTVIHGNFAELDQLGNYTTGEFRHGLFINKGAENIVVNDLVLSNMAGDGVYVGTYPVDNAFPPKNIELNNVISRLNRRQGISVTNARGLRVNGGDYRETGYGLSGFNFPMAGVDIEPNNETSFLENITFSKTSFNGNRQTGIELNLTHLDATSHPVSVTFNDCKLDDNGMSCRFIGCKDSVKGSISVLEPTVTSSRWSFVEKRDWSKNGIPVSITSPNLYKINYTNSTDKDVAASAAIKVWNKSTYDVGALTVSNLKISDSEFVAHLFGFVDESTGGYGNLYLKDQNANHLNDIPVQNLQPIFPSTSQAFNLKTQFSDLVEANPTTNEDEFAGKELGKLFVNTSGAAVKTRLSTALTSTATDQTLFFRNDSGSTMEIEIDGGLGTTFLPVTYQDGRTRTLTSNEEGEYVEIYSPSGTDYWYIKNIVGLWLN